MWWLPGAQMWRNSWYVLCSRLLASALIGSARRGWLLAPPRHCVPPLAKPAAPFLHVRATRLFCIRSRGNLVLCDWREGRGAELRASRGRFCSRLTSANSGLTSAPNKLLLFSDPSYPRNNARPLQDRFFSASALPVFSDCKLTESLLLSLELWSAGARNLPEETRQGQGQGTRHIFEK